MALPSEHITIKRRRDEEPVEALYLQQKRHKSDAREIYWHLVADFQAPVVPESSTSLPNTNDYTKYSFPNVPQVPKIRTTSPQEDLLNVHNSDLRTREPRLAEVQNLPLNNNPSEDLDVTSLGNPSQESSSDPRPNGGPRRFHFVKNTSVTSSSKSSLGLGLGARKHEKGRRSDLPVFIEKTRSIARRKSSRRILWKGANESNRDNVSFSPNVESCEQRPRRKPVVNAAERKWRNENWGKSIKVDRDVKGRAGTAQSIDEPSGQWDYSSESLAGQLQQVALQETNPATADPKGDKTSSRLKVQPKTPKRRQPTVEPYVDEPSGDESMTDMIDNDNEDDDYVYDTYVRSISLQAGASVEVSEGNVASFRNTNHGKVGILIVAEEDQEEWETFAEIDQESDKDWNSEEEDENAEDFYGNDYPEDEVKSDDEFDRGAYKYRTGASDEEEFDQDGESWSDEDEARYPWKHNGGLSSQ